MLTRIAIIALLLFVLGMGWIFFAQWNSSSHFDSLRFDLVDPEMAPASIKPLVMQGYDILLETAKYAPKYAGDRISCTNCHFSAGNTLGGPGAGISLVGVTWKYPRLLPNNQEYTLADRINACFEKSTNGKPMSVDSQEMKAMLAYLKWISKDIPSKTQTSWLGVKKLSSSHVPNTISGAIVYDVYCALCHGSDGEGEERSKDLSYPPLWGPHAFNDAAGMNVLSTLASFIYENMPYDEPKLSIEDALDVAAFIVQQPRPKAEL